MRTAGQRTTVPAVRVLSVSARASRGLVVLGGLRFPCALGRGGCRAVKREGDGATPMGRWRMGAIHYRPDRLRRPRTALSVRAMGPADGWCDAPGDRNYNRFVRHPYPASAERLWRGDALYDLLVVLSYNERPRRQGTGQRHLHACCQARIRSDRRLRRPCPRTPAAPHRASAAWRDRPDRGVP